ncbi:YdcF family protein [Rubritalea spongiae]|uniref:YdcF family protein n=1 Tax=Rubritalea spongiae TaxID=430797 RepID=A0ABW5E3Z4_9BACT
MATKKTFFESWRRRLKIGALILVLLLAYMGWQAWSIHHIGYSDDGSNADCAIVLGAAAYHTKPSPVFQARIDHAIELYKDGRVKSLVLTGGYGKDAEFSESEVAYDYCVENGIPERDLFIEKKSQTTEQNIMEAQKLMRAENFDNALLVSDPWHLKRALAMAKKHDVEAKPSATRTTMYRSEKSQWQFLLREMYHIHVWRLVGE